MPPIYGRVYRIEFQDGYYYLGCTEKELRARLAEHKYERMKNLKLNTDAGYMPRTRFDLYLAKNGWNEPRIMIVEGGLFDNKTKLKDREMEHIVKHYHDPKNLNAAVKGVTRYYTPEQKMCRLEELCNKQLREWAVWIEKEISKILDGWTV